MPIELLISAFEAAGYEIFMQGTVADDYPLPDKFVTYRVTTTDYSGYFDNINTNIRYSFTVYLYSREPADCLPGAASKEINAVLKPLGFKSNGAGRPLGHFNSEFYCWVNEYFYNLKEEE